MSALSRSKATISTNYLINPIQNGTYNTPQGLYPQNGPRLLPGSQRLNNR